MFYAQKIIVKGELDFMLYKKNILKDEEVPWKIQKTWNNLKNEWSRKLDIL